MSVGGNLDHARWRKSSRSNGHGGACVEVAVAPNTVGVRDSKDRDGGRLIFARKAWAGFVSSLKVPYH